MKMKTDKKQKIQSKIARPYFWTMIALAVVIVISFNLVMRLTMNRMAQDEIKESRETLKILLRDALKRASSLRP
jgi:Na+/melibiose symporter-like transporter